MLRVQGIPDPALLCIDVSYVLCCFRIMNSIWYQMSNAISWINLAPSSTAPTSTPTMISPRPRPISAQRPSPIQEVDDQEIVLRASEGGIGAMRDARTVMEGESKEIEVDDFEKAGKSVSLSDLSQ